MATNVEIPKKAWVMTDYGAYRACWYHPQHMPRELQEQFPRPQRKKCSLCGSRPPLHWIGRMLLGEGWIWFEFCKPCDELMDLL